MKTFKDLQTQWKNQEEVQVPENGAERIMTTLTDIKRKQRLTNGILLTTAVVLICFFFYVSAFKFQTVLIGLLLMIGSLFFRIVLELLSLKKLRSMDPLNRAVEYKRQMIRYYHRRRIIHLVITPLIILTYCVGFWLLLPAFKSSLSAGFYQYIVWSSVVVLLILGFFIGRQIQEELKVLRGLKE
ncbi:hypothetical protein [Maribacter sp. 2307UL18-2]|uniref:hypothetical protein n=1 Tax=Maribacter sp. 2307UL18-2 TaxID=3386274 RepID=UPI0039BD82B2